MGVICGWFLSGSWWFWKFRRHMKQDRISKSQTTTAGA
jgi:hypothetical protein